MRTASQRYFDEIKRLSSLVESTQAEAIERAAAATAEALAGGGFIYTFGTGHSHLLALEIFYRAGGLARVIPILDEPLMLHASAARSSEAERESGYARRLLGRYDAGRGDVIFIFSNSGRNALPVETAEIARERGIKSICVTNLAHSAAEPSRAPSGKRLFEICDIVIDNCGCRGDAAIDIGSQRTGATSTAVGAMIIQAVISRAIELSGGAAEIFHSANASGGGDVNEKLIEKYKPFIKAL